MRVEQPHSVLVLPDDRPEDELTLAQFGTTLEGRLSGIDVHVGTDYGDALERIADTDIVISRHLSSEMLDVATGLEWVQSTSAGVDHYDTEALSEAGIVLTSASGVRAEAIAEQVLLYMLAFERKLHVAFRQQREHRWERFNAGELLEKTVAIVGVGAIGSRVAERCSAFETTVVGVKRDTSQVPDGVDEIYAPDELHTALGRADYVVLACPLTEETRNLLTIKEFTNSMKRSSVLVNVARGEVVDERHLAIAVGKGEIGGAAIDVAHTEPLPRDSPLWNLENVIVTPHMAGSTPKFFGRVADLFCENYRRYVEGGPDGLKNRIL